MARKTYDYTGKHKIEPIKPDDYVFGRPTKYKPEFCGQLIAHMKLGYSFKSFGSNVNVTCSTLDEWVKNYPDFSVAKQQGKMHERAVWEKIHTKCAITGQGNAAAIIWAQKNKFPEDYKERNEPAQINVNTQLNNVTVNQWDSNSDARMKQLLTKEQGLLALNEKEIIEVL
jgi:transposase